MVAEDTARKTTAPRAARRSRLRALLAAALVAYAVAICLLWLWMYLRGDRGWLATLFLFGPRWICALPLAVLLPAAAIWQRRLLWLPAITAVLVFGPILGFEVHFADDSGMVDLRVLTCNVNQFNFDSEKLAVAIDRIQPDIVALQEVPSGSRRLNWLAWPRGWYVMKRDELIVASRFPVVDHETLTRIKQPAKLTAVRCTVELPQGEVQLFNLHFLSPRLGFEAVLDRKRGLDLSKTPNLEALLELRGQESRRASQWIEDFPGPKIVVGDFNMPIESAIFRADWSGLENAFSTAGFGFGFTKITEEQGWSYGARIDHVLFTPPWRCVRAWVGPDIGSDHLPLVAEFK